MSKYSKLTKRYNTADLCKTVAALQLLPENHGKSVRIEDMARITVVNFNGSLINVPFKDYKKIIDREYPYSKYEDRPVNLFTENIMFYGGNYTVFPGIKESGSTILNNLLQAIFIRSEEDELLPKAFIASIYSGTLLMLTLSNVIANRSGLTRNQYSKKIKKEIEFPSIAKITNLKEAVTFSENWIKDNCEIWKIQDNIIEKFVIAIADPSLLQGHPSISPLCNKPLVKIKDEYILIQPISVVECLIHFIWQEAEQNKCNETLIRLYNDVLWRETQRLVYQMRWLPTSIELPVLSSDLYCRETVCVLDLNKLTYVCFLEANFAHSIASNNISFAANPSDEMLAYANLVEDRQNEVYEYLNKNINHSNNEFFTLYVISEVGFPQQYALPESKKEKLNLFFRFTEFKNLVQSEEPDPLVLWKFAKTYAEVSEQCHIRSISGALDVYAIYKHNECSLWPINEKRPEVFAVMPGCSNAIVRRSVLKQDEHLAPFLEDNSLMHKFVYNYCDYAPFYMEIGNTIPSSILLEDFVVPVWFIIDQQETHHHDLIHSQLEMLAFRLYKLKSHLEKDLSFLKKGIPLIIKVVFDQRIKKEMRPGEIPHLNLENIVVPVQVNDNEIELTIPLELVYWYALPDNNAERYMILNLLSKLIHAKSGLNKLEDLKKIIDDVMPLGTEKISTILGNANNLELETRYLPPYRSLQQPDLSTIKTNLINNYGIIVNPKELSSIEGKINLCNRISLKLYKELQEKLDTFAPHQLLPMLININEACVQKKAIQVLDIPARMAAFSSSTQETITLFQKEQERIKVALSVRCLIELIVARDPIKGDRLPNIDEVDQLLALMHEVISWAGLSDGMHLEIYNPKMKLLSCGRIDVDYSSINSSLIPFGLSRTEITVDQYITGYEDLFNVLSGEVDISQSPEVMEIENAFKSDWGIGLIRLHDFIMDLVKFTRKNDGTTVGVHESILLKILKEDYSWTDHEILSGLNTLSLLSGWEIGIPPKGYKKTDTYPWYYNRALSFMRRPIAKLIMGNETAYYWSYRHLLVAFDNLLSLLFSGALQVPEKGALDTLVKSIRTKKGKIFRDEVYDWLKTNSSLEIISYEVPIKPGAKLNSNINLGDIDILAFDKNRQVIYSIECKNTVDARIAHEMKTELDKYFGKDGNPGLIQKHIVRDRWLKDNRSLLDTFINNANLYSIKSLILTSEETPLVHLKKGKLPLPFISFPKLKIEGSSAINKM